MATCQVKFPAGQFAGKLTAQVDTLLAMNGTGDHELSSRFFLAGNQIYDPFGQGTGDVAIKNLPRKLTQYLAGELLATFLATSTCWRLAGNLVAP